MNTLQIVLVVGALIFAILGFIWPQKQFWGGSIILICVRLLVPCVILLALVGCGTVKPIGKPQTFVDASGQTNTVQWKRVASGGVLGNRDSLIYPEVLRGAAPVPVAHSSSPPAVQSLFSGPVNTAASLLPYYWATHRSGGVNVNNSASSSAIAKGGSATGGHVDIDLVTGKKNRPPDNRPPDKKDKK